MDTSPQMLTSQGKLRQNTNWRISSALQTCVAERGVHNAFKLAASEMRRLAVIKLTSARVLSKAVYAAPSITHTKQNKNSKSGVSNVHLTPRKNFSISA